MKAAAGKWRPAFGEYPGEAEDPYIAACFGADLPETDAFKQTARLIYAPMLGRMGKP